MNPSKKKIIPILSWSLYDLSNQFFLLNIVSLYFPRWLTIEKQAPEIFYSLAFGISVFLAALSAPILGTISDIRQRRKGFLIGLTLVSVLATAALSLRLNIFTALAFFAIANFGCQSAIIFYNALMVNVAPPERMGFVSGLGRMFGYSGAILALYLTKPIILNSGYQATFALTAVLFLVFALPCMFFVRENEPLKNVPLTYFLQKDRLTQIFKRLKDMLFDKTQFQELRNFMIASFFGLCVVNTLILFMSVYLSKAFGLTETEVINLIAFSTVFAILGSLCSGILSDRIGHRRCFLGIFVFWAVCLLCGSLLRPPFHWLVGALVGSSLGATWVVARATIVQLVPKERIGEVFALFNLIGYLAGIVGPLYWGLMLLGLSSFGELGYRITCLSLIMFIGVGIIFLLRIPDKNNGVKY